jgi:cytosine deaminase
MAHGFAAVPNASRYVLQNATLPAALVDDIDGKPDRDGLFVADVTIADGMVAEIASPRTATGLPIVDLDRGMVWPCLVDMHTHLDKGHIWPRQPNPDGTFDSALQAVWADRAANWSAADVAARMDFSLRLAYAHGTSLVRTHIDSDPPQHRISWPVFAEMRERWKGRIELQGVSLFTIDQFLNADYADEIVDTVASHGGVLGAVTFMIPELDRAIELMMHRAANRDLDLDFHVDETDDPAARSLLSIADAALRTDFPGEIVCGHCCSLAVQPTAEAEATMDRVAEAEIAVVSLPMCNMYLQDRSPPGEPKRTPRWRGVAPVHELAARGVPVAVASDNTRDPFYAYGDLDMLEVFREAVRILQLDEPIAPWPAAVARTPANIVDAAEHGVIAAGRAADLVLTRARNFTELLARPQSDRTVLRAGKAIDITLPDFRELDHLMERRT